MLLTFIDNSDIFSDDYIINEILLNQVLVDKINTQRNIDGYSLLYLVCKKRQFHSFRVLMSINKYADKLLIDVNIKNTKNESTPLHGIIWGEDEDINKNITFIPTMINILIKNGAKNSKNKNGELPINNIRISNQKLIQNIQDLLSKISS